MTSDRSLTKVQMRSSEKRSLEQVLCDPASTMELRHRHPNSIPCALQDGVVQDVLREGRRALETHGYLSVRKVLQRCSAIRASQRLDWDFLPRRASSVGAITLVRGSGPAAIFDAHAIAIASLACSIVQRSLR